MGLIGDNVQAAANSIAASPVTKYFGVTGTEFIQSRYATDAAALKFLETGTNSVGKLAMAPMPQFRLNHEDATAVVAYLRSLKR